MSGLLSLQDLRVRFAGAERPAVDGVSLAIEPGEILGVVGESGAGKTILALAVLRLTPPAARVAGRVLWKDRDLLTLPDPELHRVRGGEIGMVFQDPTAALHPTIRVVDQVAESIWTHRPDVSRESAREEAGALLSRMGVALADQKARPWIHQWSGGMRQRAMLAMALANRPALLLADEPTTSLDVTTQAQLLGLLRELRRETGMAILISTHDLGVIAEVADRIAVLREGKLVEQGRRTAVFARPAHPYTASLLTAHRRARVLRQPLATGPNSREVARVEALHIAYQGKQRVDAVVGMSFSLGEGETLAMVGESGGGKSSLARALVRLETPTGGTVTIGGTEIGRAKGRDLLRARRCIQLVFQDPRSSFNPRRRIGASIAEPLRIHGIGSPLERTGRVRTVLEAVGLRPELAERFPHQLSGGELQRAAIARALTPAPQLVVLDEPVSALDAPSRIAILDLLVRLQDALGHAYLFIAHDLEVVRRIAHRVVVVQGGRIVEIGTTEEVFQRPAHPYTKALLAAIPAAGAQGAVAAE